MNNIRHNQEKVKINKGEIHSFSFTLLSNGQLTHKEFAVFQCIINHASDEGIAYISTDTMAKMCNISKSTAYSAVNKLQQLKLIDIVTINKPGGKRKMNVYYLKEVSYSHQQKDEYIDHQVYYEKVKFESEKRKKIQGFASTTPQTLETQTERTKNIENQGCKPQFSQFTEPNLNNNIAEVYENNNITETVVSGMKYRKNKKEDKKEINCKLTENAKKTINGKTNEKRDGYRAGVSDTLENKRLKFTAGEKQKSDFKVADEEDFGRTVTKRVRWKLYMYRQLYSQYINKNWSRLFADAVLFFLINTENLVENGYPFGRVLRTIEFADKSDAIYNPIGWLIDRFGIGRGRFYFLLSRKYHIRQETEEKQTKPVEDEYEKIKDKWKTIAEAFGIDCEDILEEVDRGLTDVEYEWRIQKKFAQLYWNRASEDIRRELLKKAKRLASYSQKYSEMTEEERKKAVKEQLIYEIGLFAEKVRMSYLSTLERDIKWTDENISNLYRGIY